MFRMLIVALLSALVGIACTQLFNSLNLPPLLGALLAASLALLILPFSVSRSRKK